MKKFILCVVLLGVCILGICLLIVLCNNKQCPTPTQQTISEGSIKTDAPLKTVNEVKDSYGNILQQVLYNTNSGDMYIYDYTYKFDGSAFYCTGSWMTKIEKDESDNSTMVDILKPTTDTKPWECYDAKVIKTLLLDSGDVKIWAVGYRYDATMGEHLFTIEAESTGDKTVVIRTSNETINDSIELYKYVKFDEMLFANENANLTVCITDYDLEGNGVSTFNSLTFDLIVCDAQDYNNIIKKEKVTINIK